MDLLGERPAALLGPETKQVLGQLNLRGQILRIELQGLPLIRRPVGETVFLRQLSSDQVIDFRVLGPVLQGAGMTLFGGLRLIGQMSDDGAIGPRLGVPSVDGDDVIEPVGRVRVLFAVDIVASSRFKHGSVTFSPDRREAYWSSEYAFNDSGYSTGGILMSKVENDAWTLPKLAAFSTVGDGDDVPFFAPDGKKLFFISRRSVDPNGQRAGEQIWYMDRVSTGWSEPHLINGGPNAHGQHWQFSVAANGNIYFSSDDSRGLGRGDIWVSKYQDGNWLPPEHLGAAINSPNLEMCPFIAPDESYLIITAESNQDSDGCPNLKICFRLPDGSWTKPIDLKPAMNISSNGICPIVSPDSKYLFFNGGFNDIYWVDAGFIETLRREALK